MRFSTLATLLFCLVPISLAQDTDLKVVQAYFEKYRIPADLKINFKPTALLNVYLPQKDGKTIAVNTGDTLPRNVTAGPPKFVLREGPSTGPAPVDPARYVIIAVDPDAPTPENPTNAQIRHFLGGNFYHGNIITPVPLIPYLANSTAAVTDYRQPSPPASTLGSPHRYIFLVYNQSKSFNNQTLVTPTTPINLWNVAKFADAVGLGDPIGGSFFLVKPELSIGPL